MSTTFITIVIREPPNAIQPPTAVRSTNLYQMEKVVNKPKNKLASKRIGTVSKPSRKSCPLPLAPCPLLFLAELNSHIRLFNLFKRNLSRLRKTFLILGLDLYLDRISADGCQDCFNLFVGDQFDL